MRRPDQRSAACLRRLKDQRLSGSPRLLDLRRDQREDALVFYDRILKQIDSRDPVVLRDTAHALMEAATLQAQVGRIETAKDQLRQALKIVKDLQENKPDEVDDLVLKANCLMKLSGLLTASYEGVVAGREPTRDLVFDYGQTVRAPAEGLAVGRESIAVAKRVVGIAPGNAGHQYLLASCHDNYANNLRDEHAEDAKVHYWAAIGILNQIDPSRYPDVSQKLAGTLNNLGVVFWRTKDYSQAEATFQRAEKLLLAQVGDMEKPAGDIATAVGKVNVNWGGMLIFMARFSEAIERAESGLKRLEFLLFEQRAA